MKIVVVGGGVSGPTCAVALLEASRGGAEVTVLTAGAPAGTVSAVAGAMMGPVFGSGDERSVAWERRSDAVFRQLAGDDAVEPVWGQHVLVDAPFVDEFVFEGGASADGISIVPHGRGVLLGGVRRPGRNLLMPDQQIAAETIARAAVAIPELATAPVLGLEAGLRPGRPRVRLEPEQAGQTTVIHDYGHDGSGVFWSWGCAADVVALCGLG